MPYKIDLEQAREIRQWWKDNVHRVHEGSIKIRDLRVEIGLKYGLSDRTIEDILCHRSHREPSA
jgi:hypothetical protein